MDLHWKILDSKRQAILPLLSSFSVEGFYLAGGTGLALQIGHRGSVDFDFFKEGYFDTKLLHEKLIEVFKGHTLSVTQQEHNILSCLIDNNIQISFFGYKHSLLQPLIHTDYFNIASIVDIGCMKFSAITSRSVEKDYIDLYFILQTFSLRDILKSFAKKYPTLDVSIVLKSLVYFDDVLMEPILFKDNYEVPFETIKTFLQEKVTDYFERK